MICVFHEPVSVGLVLPNTVSPNSPVNVIVPIGRPLSVVTVVVKVASNSSSRPDASIVEEIGVKP